MIDDVARFLRARPPAPNASPPGLPPPVVVRLSRGWPAAGWIDWWATLAPLGAALWKFSPQEVSQGFGRLLAEVVDAVGGEPSFDAVVALLDAGDRGSVERAVGHTDALQAALGPWMSATAPRRHDPVDESDWASSNPQGLDRPPAGFRVMFGAREMAAQCLKLYRKGSVAADMVTHAQGSLGSSFYNPISVLMDCRPEFGAHEILAVVYGLMDPFARRPAPGGLWMEATRRGRLARVRYGRGAAALLVAEFDLVDLHRAWPGAGSRPGPAHVLERLKAAPRAAPAPGDFDAALADLARRGVRRLSGAFEGPAVAALARAGFVDGELAPEAARRLALLAPRGAG